MTRKLGSLQIRNAYAFLATAEMEDRVFSLEDLRIGSGWSEETLRANRSKKLGPMLGAVNGGFKAMGVAALTEETFCRICSQNTTLARDPFKPLLDPKVEQLVNKARDAALAAVQHYNNPTALFKSDTYIVLMVIASTAHFHAVFERDAVDYIARNTDGSPRTLGGEVMLWDLQKSVKFYENGNSSPMVANVDLIVPLRHKIEHRFLPPLDAKIAGHCQSFLTNFETVLVSEFTSYYSMNASLCPPMSFSTQRSPESLLAMRRFQGAEYEEISKFIDEYHAALPDDVFSDPAFAFRVFLIPKAANHARTSDISVEFIPLNECTAELLLEIDKRVVAVKTATREARNVEFMLPRDVSIRVAKAIGQKFGVSSHHVRAWKAHRVRPEGSDTDKTKTDPKYCIYDSAFRTYLYTDAWVQLLIETYKDPTLYAAL